jgi:GNAT superfamily N-acetyltransferase
MKTRITTDWAKDLDNIPYGITRGMLFSGDRFSCCDEAVVGEDGDTFIGIATISFKGEDRSGKSEVVGLYIAPEFRCQGHGLRLLECAINRCLERSDRACVVAISSNVQSLIQRLSLETRNRVDFSDFSLGLNLMD